ncbi:class I SAM-dependent methyltransferase [Marixanthomonas ophiurae]|uniref:Class I SAM-dependent methyltransferase n=1 Tax=Marixanthomonas ophiurae TaxID=387659 RepID=A0A3E1Q6J7_9FLAO|nr:class I SAM-dependent methyltransferase [Marixanthomonas ophiurae]RFN57758.1 class I SAM-dependent methyltransferase [Marixanthomonas ophiurae]
MPNRPICPLCKLNDNIKYYNGKEGLFYRCNTCDLVYKASTHYPSQKNEKERYLTHNNDITDIGYQNFVSPIVNAVATDFSTNALGLDFGAGTGPVITKMLSDKGYSLTLYDTFFHPDREVLKLPYDYIVCCEVMEHFHNPDKEFLLLKSLLKPNGKLYCMTDLFSIKTNFENWHYKNDKTHVVFYSETTLKWIQQSFNFTDVEIDGRLIVFTS